MKILTVCALLVSCLGLFAAGSEKSVDGLTFVLQEGVWVQQGLETATLPEASAVVHGTARWQSWREQGSDTLRQILELGPNVVFSVPSRDGEVRVFSVHENRTSMKGAVSGSADKGTTTGLLGSSIMVGAVMTGGQTRAASESLP